MVIDALSGDHRQDDVQEALSVSIRRVGTRALKCRASSLLWGEAGVEVCTSSTLPPFPVHIAMKIPI